MADYTKNIATATRLISAKGQAMLYNSEETIFNAETNLWEDIETQTEFIGLKTNPSTDEIEAGYPTNALIILASGASLEKVKLANTITIGSKVYNIETVQEVAPAEQVILYKIVVVEKG